MEAKKGCDRNCSTCSRENQSYCAVQIALRNQDSIAQVIEGIKTIASVLQQMLPSQDPLISPNPGGESTAPEVTSQS